MLYQALNPYAILLETNESREIDAGTGAVLIPEDNSKIFLHWLNGGKLRATYTMTNATRVCERVKLINASGRVVAVKIINLG
jgi:hypothetical protein